MNEIIKEKKIRNLSRKKIFDYACSVIEKDGLEAVSMRQISIHFNVRISALYNHYSSKEELLMEMIEYYGNLQANIHGEPRKDSVENFLFDLCHQMRNAIKQRPFLLDLYSKARPDTLNVMADFEYYLSHMKNFGFDPVTAIHLRQVLAFFVLGVCTAEIHDPNGFDRSEELSKISRTNFPIAYDLFVKKGFEFKFDDNFDYALDLIIAGYKKMNKIYKKKFL